MTNIAIVDDQRLFRDSLGNLIRSIGGFQVLLECGSSEEFLGAIRLKEAELPQILLLDLEMPGMNGIELNKLLQKEFPVIRVIILSVHAQEKLIASLVRDGADGYLTKNCDRSELALALQMVEKQGYYINKMTLQAMQESSRQTMGPLRNVNGIPLDLTKREVEVLELICQEYSSTEIASRLFLSVRTVEGHRNSLLQKTGCKNIAGLVLYAVRNRIHPIGF